MYTIDFHGDDYGISKNNCIRFMELIKAERIDSISIIPNMSYYKEAMEYLHENWDCLNKKPLISVHINIMDGLSLANIDDSRLTRKLNDGMLVMNASWGKLLISSYIPGKKRLHLRELLAAEIGSQIKRVYDDLPDNAELRLDSHVHTHMIPIVFDAMMDALKEKNLIDKVKFVRVSREPLGVFLRATNHWKSYSLINIVKNILLNFLSGRAEKKLRKADIEYSCLWGLIMTGHMDIDRVSRIMPIMERWLKKRNENKHLEILCHPGIVLESESSPLYGEDDIHAFYSSDRNVEYEMLQTMCNK